MCDYDIGEAFGGMELEWLEEKLIDFGYSIDESSANDILQRLNACSTTRHLKNDDVVDGLIAHLLNLKKTNVSVEFVDDYDAQLATKPKPKQCSSNASTSVYNALQRSILRELPVTNSTIDFDDNNDMDSIFQEDDFNSKDVKRESVLGNVKLSYRGKLFSLETDTGSSPSILPLMRLLCDCAVNAYTYGNSNLMFDLSEIFDDENTNTLNFKEENDEKSDIEITSVLSGMIMPEEGRALNLQNAVLFTNSRIVPLDLEKLEQFSLFPGNKVKLRGSFVNNVFQVQEIIQQPTLRMAKLGRNFELDSLRVCVACGPFSLSGDSCVSNTFLNLLSHTVRANINALILIGPFVNKDCTLKGSNEDILNAYLQTISKFISAKKLAIRVLIVPSAMSDVNAMPYFPTPPYEVSNVLLNENITLLPDPALFELEGVRFAVSASEIITHLSKREVYKSANAENEDRMQRLFSHIFTSRSLYPLYPSDSSLPFSLKGSQRKVELLEKPHVLILPSILQPVIKVVDNCVAFNPGKFIRGKSGGTFAMLTIDLKSTVNDSIAASSAVNLLSNVIS